MRLRIALIAFLAAVLPLAVSARVQLRESGSTLLYPVMNAWVSAYTKVATDVDVATEASGSGAGVAAAENGTVHIGASDAFLSDAVEARNDVTQIPLAISGQFVAYQVPGAGTLHLSADVLAGIYAGKIVKWNDSRIALLNPSAKLPDATIVPLRRSDRSGDTFLFTSYLAAQASHVWTSAPDTAITWPPVAGELSAKGNRELLDLLYNTQYGIGYIGISLYAQAEAYGIGIAALRNHDGQFVTPTRDALATTASHIGPIPRNARISLIDLPGPKTYPIVNVEYAIVKKKQSDPGVAQAVRAFLDWIVEPSGGNAHDMLDPVHFLPLPDPLRAYSRQAIAALR